MVVRHGDKYNLARASFYISKRADGSKNSPADLFKSTKVFRSRVEIQGEFPAGKFEQIGGGIPKFSWNRE